MAGQVPDDAVAAEVLKLVGIDERGPALKPLACLCAYWTFESTEPRPWIDLHVLSYWPHPTIPVLPGLPRQNSHTVVIPTEKLPQRARCVCELTNMFLDGGNVDSNQALENASELGNPVVTSRS